MSILDLVDDGSFEWIIRGDGYSLARAQDGDKYRWRADVDNGVGNGRTVPLVTDGKVMPESWVEAITTCLLADYAGTCEVFPSGRINTAHVERNEYGYERALSLKRQMRLRYCRDVSDMSPDFCARDDSFPQLAQD